MITKLVRLHELISQGVANLAQCFRRMPGALFLLPEACMLAWQSLKQL